ncbi:AAA family ATPase [Mucilaginibacter sp. AW1-3]
MISRFEVKNLFGVFNHSIPLTDNNDITLVIGENGLGKTIILKLIKAFFDSNFLLLKDYVYDEFTIWFTDKSRIIVKKQLTETECSIHFELKQPKVKKTQTFTFYSFDKNSKKVRMSRLEDQRRLERLLYERDLFGNDRRYYTSNDELHYFVDRFLPSQIERIAANKWIDNTTGSAFSYQELLSKYTKYFPPEILQRFGEGIPEWLTLITGSIKVKLIETQRLLMQADEGKYRPSVTNYSNQLVETIKNKRSESTDLGSNLDRTYPNRVVNNIAKSKNITESFITESFLSLKNKRALLNDVGLLDTEEDDLQPNINSSFKQKVLKEVLSIYIEDSNKKLSIYDDLATRIKLLLDIINKRFTYKKLSIDKNKGFVFTSTINGKEIPLSGLSSGEQHELVLYFELLFNTSKNSLLLIDEPEISLHISWQKQFIRDLSSVTTLNNLTVIIATHSPDIIGNHWPLTVEIRGIN